jgi:hypothetical protein
MPELIKAPVKVFPDENAEIIILVESGNFTE